MIDFLTSDKGLMMLLVIGIIGAVGFVLLNIAEAIMFDEFDPVCEEKCKKCICYEMCRNHGCIYDCRDYMTEEMLRRKGMENESKKRGA